MPIDKDKAMALELAPFTATVERGRLRFFAEATGQSDPVYSDVDAARAAGHPDLLVPPTFLFGLALERPDPFGYLTELGIDLRFILHGEQLFGYHRLAYAGDQLTLRDRITDVYAKRGGALEFLVKETEISRDCELVAESRSVIVVRHPEAAQ